MDEKLIFLWVINFIVWIILFIERKKITVYTTFDCSSPGSNKGLTLYYNTIKYQKAEKYADLSVLPLTYISTLYLISNFSIIVSVIVMIVRLFKNLEDKLFSVGNILYYVFFVSLLLVAFLIFIVEKRRNKNLIEKYEFTEQIKKENCKRNIDTSNFTSFLSNITFVIIFWLVVVSRL